MKNLKVWQKLAVLGVVLMVPFAVVLWQMVSSIHKLDLDPTNLEIQGVEYLTPLHKFMREAQVQRAVTQGVLAGDANFRDRAAGQREAVEAAIQAVDVVNEKLGATLKCTQDWNSIREHARELMSKSNLSPTESFNQYNALVNETITLIQYIGDTSTLTLDPDLNSYYLMNVIVFRQPELAENLGQARTAGVLGLGKGAGFRGDRTRLIRLYGVNDYLTRDVDLSLRKASEHDAEVKNIIAAEQSAAMQSIRSYLQLLQELPQTRRPISRQEYFNAATAAIDSTYKISDTASPALVELLQARIGRLQQQIMLTLFWSLLGLAVVGVIGCYLIRDITRPLQTTVGIAQQIAAGNLNTVMHSDDRRDELGALLSSFNNMTQALRRKALIADKIADGDLNIEFETPSPDDALGNSLSKMLFNLRTMTGNISTAVNQLGSSSSQILASTSQLSATASETAAAITQTTTTVEEVRQTAHVSNEKAQLVAQTAQRAAQTAQEGNDATDKSTAGMQRIREQMDAIAQSMIRLSEQSSAIGEIIASVDDLTQQSNLLAVNAAIEAAKAGEQGKGFAVVAQEVKNLAEQSRQATGQVRTILSDIQKATGAAVMATEQGTKVVEAGALQSGLAGEAIQNLSEGIEESAHASMQIAASSQQQLVGVDQVAIAMDNVRQASMQNVDSAHQLEVAARDLNELGRQLQGLIAQYKV